MTNKVQRRFTISELREFDGKEGRSAYLAYMGKVYDVSSSSYWKMGKHPGGHSSGRDLTEGIINAPHGEELLLKFQVVGELRKEESFRQKLVQRLEKRHLHPILVHFSIGYSILVPLLSILFFFTRNDSFEVASYYVLVLGYLAAPAAGLSGIFSWKVTYEGRITKTFSRKRNFTIILFVVMTVCFVWRTLNPNILIKNTKFSYIYLALIASFVPITTTLGYDGGKIVHS